MGRELDEHQLSAVELSWELVRSPPALHPAQISPPVPSPALALRVCCSQAHPAAPSTPSPLLSPLPLSSCRIRLAQSCPSHPTCQMLLGKPLSAASSLRAQCPHP